MPGFPPPHSKKNLLLKTKREIIKKDEDQSALEFSTSLPYWSVKGPTFIPPPPPQAPYPSKNGPILASKPLPHFSPPSPPLDPPMDTTTKQVPHLSLRI